MAVDVSIRRDVPIPYYYQLIQVLQSEIHAGSWPPNAAIPSEHELCRMFNVSRTVVRQALGELVAKGLLYRVKGKGTFVTPSKLKERFIQRSDGFYREMTSRGFTVRSSVLEQRIVEPPANVRDQLRLAQNSSTLKLERLRFVDEEPIQLVTTYIPSDLCPDLVTADLTTGSLYDMLRSRYGLAVASGVRVLEAVAAQRPVSTLLGLNKGAPLFKMESVSYLQDGRPLEYYVAWHRGDRSKFEIEVVSGATSTAALPVVQANAGR
jgi:GntR family transcriptional regulator